MTNDISFLFLQGDDDNDDNDFDSNLSPSDNPEFMISSDDDIDDVSNGNETEIYVDDDVHEEVEVEVIEENQDKTDEE